MPTFNEFAEISCNLSCFSQELLLEQMGQGMQEAQEAMASLGWECASPGHTAHGVSASWQDRTLLALPAAFWGYPQSQGKLGGHILHIIHLRHVAFTGVQSQGQDGGEFSDRVFTGFVFGASVRAEQHSSRLQRDTGPCNSISFDQFFSGVGNTAESVSAVLYGGLQAPTMANL